MKKFLVLIFVVSVFLAGSQAIFVQTFAQSRGIGVTPSEIVLEVKEDYPKTVQLTVRNFSNLDEWIEISFSENLLPFAVALPGRFVIPPERSARVNLVFDQPKGESGEGPSAERKEEKGVIRVSALRTSAEGLSTGTGIEIPVVWQNQNSALSNSFNRSALLGNVRRAFSETLREWPIKIAFLTLIAILLWRLSEFLSRQWSKNSPDYEKYEN